MSKIIKQFTKIIFPFHFENESVHINETVYENSKGKKFQKFLPFSVSAEYLRSGLDLLLNENGGTSKIADCYTLNIHCRTCFHLPSQKSGKIDFTTRNGQTFSIALEDICIYFFESKVGFLEFQFDYQTESLKDYSEISYFLCEAKSNKNLLSCTRTIGKDADGYLFTETHEFSIAQLIQEISKNICNNENDLKFFFKQEKPLIYSYVLTDKKPDDINNLIYHFNKNYKDSYKFDPDCLGVNTIHPFENYYWTASLSGATNLSYETDDSTTNAFFEDGFYEKALNTYYYLFLNVLHQRYSISRITADMGNLDCLVRNHQIMEKQLQAAQECESRAVNLKFRAFFQNPSSVDHINAYYNMLGKAFNTESLFNSFSSDISNLQNICNRYVGRIKARDDKLKQLKTAKTEILVLIFGIVVAELSIFKNSWDVIEKILGHTVNFWSIAIILLLISLISPLATVVINIKKQISKIKQLNEELNNERERNLVEDDKMRLQENREQKRQKKKALRQKKAVCRLEKRKK